LKKRAQLDIVSLILETCSIDAYDTKKTTVTMYNALLRHPSLEEYWNGLTQQGLLAYDNATQTFKTTEKGLKFLEVFSKLNRYQEKRKKTILAPQTTLFYYTRPPYTGYLNLLTSFSYILFLTNMYKYCYSSSRRIPIERIP